MDVQVRTATVADAPAIARVNAAGWRVGFRGCVDQGYLARYDGLPKLRRQALERPGADDLQLVAVAGTEVVGWLSGAPAQDEDTDPGAYEIRACYVDPSRWRQGVGRRLVRALVDRLDGTRWTGLVLWTVRDGTGTNAFYASLGLARDGREAVLDRGGPVALVRFAGGLAGVRAAVRGSGT